MRAEIHDYLQLSTPCVSTPLHLAGSSDVTFSEAECQCNGLSASNTPCSLCRRCSRPPALSKSLPLSIGEREPIGQCDVVARTLGWQRVVQADVIVINRTHIPIARDFHRHSHRFVNMRYRIGGMLLEEGGDGPPTAPSSAVEADRAVIRSAHSYRGAIGRAQHAPFAFSYPPGNRASHHCRM